MNRQEAIQQIVWCLLAHADEPAKGVAAALALKANLGSRAQSDFRNLLRAAGLFARDDDGFFMRYVGTGATKGELQSLPAPTHLLTVPVPVEPRMRIAYSVFTGLLLKHLYQRYAVVPLQVTEGMALLWAPEQPTPPASSLPADAQQIWQEFQKSKLVEDALQDGIEATLSAVGNIGAISVTDSLGRGPVLKALLQVLPSHEREFQSQGGMRLDFYFREDIEKWKSSLGVNARNTQAVENLWEHGLNRSDAKPVANEIAATLVSEALDVAAPMPFRYVRGLWRGEGTGGNRKPGKRDGVRWPQTDKTASAKAEEIDDAVEAALNQLERWRSGAYHLDRWVATIFAEHKTCSMLISSLASRLSAAATRSLTGEEVKQWEKFVDDLSDSLRKDALIAFLRANEEKALAEIRAAVLEACKNVFAWHLARNTGRDDIAIFGWPVVVLRGIPEDKRFALRFLDKIEPPGAKMVFQIPRLGKITVVGPPDTASPPPFILRHVGQSQTMVSATTLTLVSGTRCLVCGSTSDLLKGAASFLPESKKRWYESPTSFVEPKLCSNCAFVAYLSAIYPNDNITVVEFPADNFLELFALHEQLQGVSGPVALKVLNRVGALLVLPSRYLLLSKKSGRGQMDSKAQIYVQLRYHRSLLENLDRPMRVQVEGNQPSFWSEIHPYVAIGLSYFARLPNYYETNERKVVAQRMVRALTEGRPFAAVYLAAEAERPGRERDVLSGGLQAFEREFVGNRQYAAKLALGLGGDNVHSDFYKDVVEFSNYLLDLVRPLVQREVRKSGSAVSGVARKYTNLIVRDFKDGRVAKFLYVICQEADSAERDGEGWPKSQCLEKLYGREPTVETNSAEETARVWVALRDQHPKTALETKIETFQEKHGKDPGLWTKFLGEVQARTLALLMLNIRNVSMR
ncbi:MAG TPA: hypothetical protein VNL14_02310 [Candidatus Acidoferrales bacterium]|nr:hypothetical protein [Candidatus Acidoferrales bacterium]